MQFDLASPMWDNIDTGKRPDLPTQLVGVATMAEATVVIGDIRLLLVDCGFNGEKHVHRLEFYNISDTALDNETDTFVYTDVVYEAEDYNDCQNKALTAFAAVICSDIPDLPASMMNALGELSITDAAQWLPGPSQMAKTDRPETVQDAAE